MSLTQIGQISVDFERWRFAMVSLVLVLLFPSCVPVEIRGDYLQKGFDYTNLGYTSLPESSPLNETLIIENLRVIIVGSLDEYQSRRITHEKDYAAQPVEPSHEIWVIGKKLKEKIIISQVVLGYELKNLMHLIQPDVLCPCDLETFEACLALYPPTECGEKNASTVPKMFE